MSDNNNDITLQDYAFILNPNNDTLQRYWKCQTYFYDRKNSKWKVKPTIAQLRNIKADFSEFYECIKILFNEYNSTHNKRGVSGHNNFLKSIKEASQREKIKIKKDSNIKAVILELYDIQKKYTDTSKNAFIDQLLKVIDFGKTDTTIKKLFFEFSKNDTDKKQKD
jgi:hypothetical protein